MSAEPTTIGSYRVLRELGRGGMGVVYEVEAVTVPGARYALKLLLHQTDQARERFRREGELLCRVERHPNLVRVHSAGEHEGRLYLVLDLLEGSTLLDEANERGPLPWLRALELLEPVARALAFVHERGIVHRDVKPSNILLDREGRPHLTDFGIALAFDLGRLTRTNALVGTVRYLAPELMQGQSATGQSDVYSLGVCLFELLTLQHPHGDLSPVELARRSRTHAQPPSAHVPSLPRSVDAVVGRALEPDRADRYATALALADDLRALLDGRTPGVATSRGRRALGAVVGATVLGLGLASGWIAVQRARRTDPLELYRADLARAERDLALGRPDVTRIRAAAIARALETELAADDREARDLARQARALAEEARRAGESSAVSSGSRSSRSGSAAAARDVELARAARGDEDPLSFHVLGDVQGLARRATRVLDLLRDARAVSPADPLPPELTAFVGQVGHACLERKEFETGIALVRGALELEPRDHALRLDAIRYLKIGGFERAAEVLDFATAVLADPATSPASRGAAYDAAVEACYHLGRKAEAEGFVATAIREMPDEPHLVEKLGQLQLARGDPAALETSARLVRLSAGDDDMGARAARLRARALLSIARDGPGALEALRGYFGREPWTPDPACAEDVALAGCARVLQGDLEGARRDLAHARELEERERDRSPESHRTTDELAHSLEGK